MIGRDGNKQSAEQWTKEIEAATNAVVAENVTEENLTASEKPTSNLKGNGAELGRKTISTMDVRVLEGEKGLGSERTLGNGAPDTRALGNGAAILGAAEQVQEMAERDNGYGREYEPGISTVGEESRTEAEMRLAQDAENLWNENNPKGDSDARIVAKSQEEHGKAAAAEVGNFLAKKSFTVSDLVGWYSERQNAALLDMENPHPIGSRN